MDDIARAVHNQHLFDAIEAQSLSGVVAALKAGADANAHTSGFPHPLHWAVALGDEPIATALLNAGSNANARNAQRATPVHLAVARRNLALLVLLAAKGADVTCQDLKGWTPLHWAARSGDRDVLSHLLSIGADPLALTYLNETAQDIGTRYGNADASEFLAAHTGCGSNKHANRLVTARTNKGPPSPS